MLDEMSARATRSKLAHLMAHIMFSPPYIPPAQAAQSLRTHGYAVLQPEDFAQWMGLSVNDLQAMDADWQGLPPDAFLKDGGRYRRRRHSCFVSDGDHVHQVPHRADNDRPTTPRAPASCPWRAKG